LVNLAPIWGSYEVHVEGQPSGYFYFEDLPGRCLRSEQLTREEALEQAKAFAHTILDRCEPGES
jgi:hypothetical protein